MSALNPLFLVAAAAVAVPIFLHLFQRHQARRVSFPALRYLERTEREHARRIRLSQLLLLMLRVLVILVVVGAGARLVILGRGSSHPPTAVAIVLDNSASSGLVIGEERVLDRLKLLAGQTLQAATDEDRFWVIRAGEPWLPAIPGTAQEARQAVGDTEPGAARGDLTSAIERAVELLSNSEVEAREIHLLSDLQETGFELPGNEPAGEIPVIVWEPRGQTAPNRALTRVLVGGGLPPLQGQRAEVTVRMLATDDTSRTPVRIVIDERVRGAASLTPGTETSIPLPASGPGWVRGYADADPDDLRADDRRYFAFRSRAAPTVTVAGEPGLFVNEALAVLEDGGRITRSPEDSADLLVSHNGSGLERRASATAAVVVPDADPTLLPALNRRLVEAGIPWRYQSRSTSGEVDLTGSELPSPLSSVRVRQWFTLSLTADPTSPPRRLAEAAGAPWAVEGTDQQGRPYLLLASSLDQGSSTLPVSTGMLRFVDWAANEWSGAATGVVEHVAGQRLSAPSSATHVEYPSGLQREIDGTRTLRATGEAGFYTFLANDSVVSVMAVNPPESESRLEPLERGARVAAIGPRVTTVESEAAWSRSVFRTRQGPEAWWWLLLLAALLLALESFVAASGRSTPTRATSSPISNAAAS